MRVIYKSPGANPFPADIDNTVEQYQNLVGGYFEMVRIGTDAAIICNDEALLTGMKLNCTVMGHPFYGPIFLVGLRGNDFCDVPGAWEEMNVFKDVERRAYE